MNALPLAAAGLLGLAAFLGLLLVLVRRPWLGPWFAVPLFAASAELQLRLGGPAGVLKDVVTVAIVAAAVVQTASTPLLRARLRVWAAPLGALGVVVGLYLVNPIGSHGLDWLIGLRLVIEAASLLLAGLVTLRTRRTRHHLVAAVATVAAAEAVLAWIQHAVGQSTLVFSWGYQFGAQVRLTSSGGLRTSGTFSDPFALAALGVVALVLGLFVANRRRTAVILIVSSVAIIGATSVRTAVLQLLVVLLIWAVHRGWLVQAAAVAATVVAAGVLAGSLITTAAYPGAPETPLILGLNGRVAQWQATVQGPQSLLLGNGVAQVGSGSDRAGSGVLTQAASYDPATNASASVDSSTFLDSSYAQVQSDTGILGTAALLIWLLGTLVTVLRAVDGPSTSASVRPVAVAAIGLLVVSAADWLGRTTLFAFPTGFVTLYVLGVLLAPTPTPTRTGSPWART